MRSIAAVSLLLLSQMVRAASMEDRFVWIFGIEWSEPAGMAQLEKVLDDAAAHGINGVVASGNADSLQPVQAACEKRGLELIPAQFSFGYGGPFLGRNRNLAEGLEVREARFLVGEDGKATLVQDPDTVIRNGGFEEHEGDRFRDFGFHDDPGVISFADTEEKHSGACSMRLTNFSSDKWGHGRVNETVKVTPHRCYLVSIWAKSRDLKADQFKIMTLAPVEGEKSLSFRSFRLPATAEWTKFEYVFNSGRFDKAVLYAGVWEGKSGTLWLDDWEIRELGPMNPLRRPGTPVLARCESMKNFEEGKQVGAIVDPELHPWRINPEVTVTVPEKSRVKPGTHCLLSWFHPMIIHDSQVNVCMAEPEIYRIVDEEAKALIGKLHPKRILLNMDEIRMGGTCRACRGKDMGKLLGESITKIVRILRKHDPKIGIYCWSDMFDPNHNAHGNYYHVEGDYTGSWKHIPKDVTMAIWGGDINPKSFDFFTKQGFRILGACYYDADTLDSVKPWVEEARRNKSVRGLMYTTWNPRYELLPAFGDMLAGK